MGKGYILGFTSNMLGAEVPSPSTLPWKNPEDPVWLKAGTSRLQITHLTTEPPRTPVGNEDAGKHLVRIFLTRYSEDFPWLLKFRILGVMVGWLYWGFMPL